VLRGAASLFCEVALTKQLPFTRKE